ncbi:hypothetical protein CONLIGDRAFT_690401 [Coniochaeta ligniaria NRRL 30616]|uniref:Secreted protein n=1 Tax=Coniochaeta ligniaria NRRL 30616 TaxID=1408157 RepID=A0A1J7JQM9_9PEZI|nr:hypothetical protein CONLIGDRAFT_690401 [Coniochaeta ligniaria NRRL 30616]
MLYTMRSIFVSTVLVALTAFTSAPGAQAASGTICLYLNHLGTPDGPCADLRLFGCYDGADVYKQCLELSPDGIYSYSVTGTDSDDDQSCSTFNSAQNSIADFWHLLDDTDCSEVGATQVWTECTDTTCVDISNFPAYYMIYSEEAGISLR